MQIQLIPVNKPNHDNITNLDGYVTHANVALGGNIEYFFRPNQINPKTRLPVDGTWINAARLQNQETVTVDLPEGVLGTVLTDKASGFTGKAIDFILHPNGCFHVTIQPEGIVEETGRPVMAIDFNIQSLTGDALREDGPAAQVVEAQRQVPGPDLVSSRQRNAP